MRKLRRVLAACVVTLLCLRCWLVILLLFALPILSLHAVDLEIPDKPGYAPSLDQSSQTDSTYNTGNDQQVIGNNIADSLKSTMFRTTQLPKILGLHGAVYSALFTTGDTLPLGEETRQYNIFTTGQQYLLPGAMSGMAVLSLGDELLRIFVNHKLDANDGYRFPANNYTLSDLVITGARTSFVDVHRFSQKITGAGLAIGRLYQGNGTLFSRTAQIDENADNPQMRGGLLGLGAATMVFPSQFSIADNNKDIIYFTGTEASFSKGMAYGGRVWALNVNTGDMWAVPHMGRGAFKNIIPVDPPDEEQVAFVLTIDQKPVTTPYMNSQKVLAHTPGSVLYLYIGLKSKSGNFLQRNGLASGRLYVWRVSHRDKAGQPIQNILHPQGLRGRGTRLNGEWVMLDHYNPRMAGQAGYDNQGYKSSPLLEREAAAKGGYVFAKTEDIDRHPFEPNRLVIAEAGGDGMFDNVNLWGMLYELRLDTRNLHVGERNYIRVLYDGNQDLEHAIRNPDNVSWSRDEQILVTEYRSYDDGWLSLDSEDDARIVQFNPHNGNVVPVARILPNLSTNTRLKNSTYNIGDWGASDIIDVSKFFQKSVGSLFLVNVMASTEVGGFLQKHGLVEGGQMGFLDLSLLKAASEQQSNVEADL